MPSLVQITDLDRADPPETILDWYLDSPREGAVVEVTAIEVLGWVIAADVPAVGIEIKVNGQVARRVPVNRPRPDVASAIPTAPSAANCGFQTALPFRGAAAQIDLEVSVLLANHRAVPMATMRGERVWRGGGRSVDEALVSVVIPAYDQAHFLCDAIDSVMAQTHPHIEVVVIDDGSHDNTAVVTASYPGVRCVRQENRGLAESRNTGIRHTVGDYLVFLDADDRLRPDALEAGLKAFAARPECGYVFGEFVPIAHDGAPLESPPSPGPEGGYLDLLGYNFLPIHAVMFRRGVFEGGRGFDPTIWTNGAGADWDFLLTGMREFPVYGHGATVCEYRRHGSSMNRDAGTILRSEMAVLRRHRAAARAVAGGRQAHRAGMRRSKNLHGPLLAEQVRSAVAKRDWAKAMSGTRTLARHYPRGLLRLLGHQPGVIETS